MNEERKLVNTNQKYQIYIFTIYLKNLHDKFYIYIFTWLPLIVGRAPHLHAYMFTNLHGEFPYLHD